MTTDGSIAMGTRRTREDWKMLLEDMAASGLTQKAWCAANGINYSTMREMKSRIEDTADIKQKGTRRHEGQTKRPQQPKDDRDTSWIRLPAPTPPQSCDHGAIRVHTGAFVLTIEVAR
jgi:hypothetical protein